MDGVLPFARREHELVILGGRGAEDVAYGALVGAVGASDGVEDVLFSLPLVYPFPELHRVIEVPRTAVQALEFSVFQVLG